MSQTVNRNYSSKELLKRYSPYLLKYKGMLIFDLFCASMTTLCDIALPRIMSYLTNTAMNSPQDLTVSVILKLAALYVVLRLIDAVAYYYMRSKGHIMGVYIETDMRSDAFAHLEKLSDNYFANTKIGQIMGRISNDLQDITEFSHHCPEEFFIAFIKMTVSFIIMYMDPLLAGSFAVTLTVADPLTPNMTWTVWSELMLDITCWVFDTYEYTSNGRPPTSMV